ncbi:MAG: DEAD/DEAH box helicase [Conexivisphaerales archaeon]
MKESLAEEGYSELYPTQVKAIEAGLFDGENILLSTPTASGKTLVAILAAGRILAEKGLRVAYLAPLRALAYEKYEDFQLLRGLKTPNRKGPIIKVSTGDYDSSGEELLDADVLVLTNEKFDSLTRQRPTWVKRFGLFIIDEVHLLGDRERGATLEIVLSKIKTLNSSAQILALSATVKNGRQIADWLKAKLVDLKWRPVPLKEGVALDSKIYFDDGSVLELPQGYGNTPIGIALDSLKRGGQALVFADTRKRAVKMALTAAGLTGKILAFDESAELRSIAAEILNSAEETEISRMLAECVRNGVAFHHAGLAPQHRRIIEKEFKRGKIKMLFATPTLASGINLPARRVVVSSLSRYDSGAGVSMPLEVMDYKQMSGRAGRPKFDKYGEAIILARDEEEMNMLFDMYIKGEPEVIRSQLLSFGIFRKHALGMIASTASVSEKELSHFFSNTLLAEQAGEQTIMERVEKSLSYLVKNQLVTKEGNVLKATRLGKRIATLYIDPETGLRFVRILKKVGDSEEDLTPGYLEVVVSSPDFSPKMALRAKDEAEAEAFLEVNGSRLLLGSEEEWEGRSEWMRSLLVMHAWINETTDEQILERFGVEPGDLHRAVEVAEWLTYSFRELASLLGLKRTARNLDQLRVRVAMGIRPELIPLVSLEGVGRVRARSLFNAGFRSISSIASATEVELSRVPKIGDVIASRIKKQASELVARLGR